MKQRHFIFTHNNYTEDDIENYKKLDTTYIIFGYETAPTTGTPHLQGYFHTKNPRTLSGIRKQFPKASIRIPDGPPKSQFDYCSKDGKYFERGTLPMSNVEKGKAGAQVYIDAINSAKSGNFDDIPALLYTRYYKTYHAIADEHYKPKLELEIPELYPWQNDIIAILQEKPHPRRIHWRWSENGGVGKSTFSLYLVQQFNAVYLTNAKSADIAHSLPREPKVVLFDLPKESEGRINYNIIEQIKNGAVFSAKYESRTKIFSKPHIIVFANFEPDYKAFSSDRYDVIKLD